MVMEPGVSTYVSCLHTPCCSTSHPDDNKGTGCKRGSQQPRRGQYSADVSVYGDHSPALPFAPHPKTAPPKQKRAAWTGPLYKPRRDEAAYFASAWASPEKCRNLLPAFSLDADSPASLFGLNLASFSAKLLADKALTPQSIVGRSRKTCLRPWTSIAMTSAYNRSVSRTGPR